MGGKAMNPDELWAKIRAGTLSGRELDHELYQFINGEHSLRTPAEQAIMDFIIGPTPATKTEKGNRSDVQKNTR
jgi:hypothetical protein